MLRTVLFSTALRTLRWSAEYVAYVLSSQHHRYSFRYELRHGTVRLDTYTEHDARTRPGSFS